MFCMKTATDVTWLKNALKNLNENNVGTVQDRGPKKDFVIAVPYLPKMFLQIRTRVNRIMQNKPRYYNIRFVFKIKCKISNLLKNYIHLKNSITRMVWHCCKLQFGG